MIEGHLSIYYIYEDQAPEAAYDQLSSPVEYAERTWLSLVDAETMDEWFAYDRPAVTHAVGFDTLVSTGVELVDDVVQFTRDTYQSTGPTYVFGITDAELEAIGMENTQWGIASPIDTEAFAAGRIPQPMSLMLLPPPMVETYGREWTHELPVARIEDFPDGAVLIVGAEQFGDCESGYEVEQRITEARSALEETFGVKHGHR